MKPTKLLIPALLSIPVVFAADVFAPLTTLADWVFRLGSFVWVSDKISATKIIWI